MWIHELFFRNRILGETELVLRQNNESTDHADPPTSTERMAEFEANPPGRALLERAQTHPDRLVASLFEEYHSIFWHIVTFRLDRRLISRLDAEDVIQDAFLACKQRLGHWVRDAKYSLFAWTRMTLVQTLVDIHRRHIEAGMRSAARETSLAGSALQPTTAASMANLLAASQTTPSGKAIREENQEELQNAIQQMSELDQEMIAMRHFEGLNNKQAATVLGLSTTAASNRYVRALARLEKILGVEE